MNVIHDEFEIGTKVRLKRLVRVSYQPPRPDTILRAGTKGRVVYRHSDLNVTIVGVEWIDDLGEIIRLPVLESELEAHRLGTDMNNENIHADPFDGLGTEGAEAIKRLLHYSWRDINHEYERLTPEEKRRIDPATFARLLGWIGRDNSTLRASLPTSE